MYSYNVADVGWLCMLMLCVVCVLLMFILHIMVRSKHLACTSQAKHFAYAPSVLNIAVSSAQKQDAPLRMTASHTGGSVVGVGLAIIALINAAVQIRDHICKLSCLSELASMGGTSLLYLILCLSEQTCAIARTNDLEEVRVVS